MLEVGALIGEKYQLVGVLGRGGMGAVYEAIHRDIGARVAVKLLHPRSGDDPTMLIRFRREARAAGSIGHPAIVRVHDIGQTDEGVPYQVMELLRGQSVGGLLAREGRIDPELAAYIACQLLSGLSAAHAAGVVHRDLKPENVFLTESGTLLPGVKILDFGISRAIGGEADVIDGTRLTQDGSVLGTPEYMSPEQARGEERIDHRSDLYSVGVMLFECLTGVVPFRGVNYNSVLHRIVTDPAPSPREIRPEVPPALERLILRALSKHAEDRFASASEMFRALLPFVSDTARALIPPPETGADRAAGDGQGDFEADPTISDAALAADTKLSWESGERSRRRTRWILVAGALTIVAGAVTGLLLRGETETVTPPPALAAQTAPADERPPQAAPAPRVATVEITLAGLPEGARVYLDDELRADRPLALTGDGTRRELRVEAEGYEPYRRWIAPREDATIEIELTPAHDQASRDQRSGTRPRSRHRRNKRRAQKQHQPGYFVPLPRPSYMGDP